jgi:NitT/TauT family transport system substrate-binding protein
LLVLVPTVAAGCGSSSDDGGGGSAAASSSSSGGGSETVNVGVLPISAVAPVYLGIDKGFFREQGLDVKPQVAQGGAAIVPEVVSQDVAFGYANPGSILLANAKGLPLQIVSEGNQNAEQESSDPETLVAKASTITDPKQLEGQKVAVDTLGGLTELSVRDALRKLGVDDSKVTFVEIGFPDMGTALDSGRVAAAAMNEPFVTQQVRAGGMRELTHPFFAALGPGASISEYFTSAQYARAHPDTVTRFQTAMKRSLAYAQAHPDEVRDIVRTYTKTDPATLQAMKLTSFSPDLNTASIRKIADLMVQYGQLDAQPRDFTTLLGPGA